MHNESETSIRTDADIVIARRAGRDIAASLEFSATDQVLIATVISELARNILMYARQGEIVVDRIYDNGRKGLVVVARDHRPGNDDVGKAREIGYSTSGGLGLGLPGVRRLMDEFEISSRTNDGTTVTVRKWHS